MSGEQKLAASAGVEPAAAVRALLDAFTAVECLPSAEFTVIGQTRRAAEAWNALVGAFSNPALELAALAAQPRHRGADDILPDGSTFEEIEACLDAVEAPILDPGGRRLSLDERVTALATLAQLASE